jgi:acetyltransferase-like isoleucine patch superfamily enzyme
MKIATFPDNSKWSIDSFSGINFGTNSLIRVGRVVKNDVPNDGVVASNPNKIIRETRGYRK